METDDCLRIKLTAEQIASLGLTGDLAGIDALFVEFPGAYIERVEDSYGVRVYLSGEPA